MSFAEVFKDFASHRQPLFILILACAMLVVYWYKGYHFYFKEKFKDVWGKSEYFEWMAHIWQFLCAWILLVIVPVIYIKLFTDRALSSFGVTFGRWGIGLPFVVLMCVFMTPFLRRTAKNKEFYNEYPLVHGLYGKSLAHMLAWELTYLTYYIPFEFFFRGFIQLGVTPHVGPAMAMCFQMFPSVIIHNNKPEGETWAALGGAFLMGLMTAVTGSLLWPILFHWYIGAVTDYFCFKEWLSAKERGEMVREALVIK